MDPIVSEWLNLVVRWIHVITGIAWIGASFYFNWLLNHLRVPPPDEPEATGELWALHAGGFFKVQKRKLAAGPLPEPLHWFKWEAYWTWISGFVLLVIVYYAGAGVYLVDPRIADLRPATAIAIGIGSLVAGWVGYDLLWRSPLGRHPALATAVSGLLLVALAVGLGEVFSPRGAYIHVGAVLGTIMAGNVLWVIMPAQRQMVAATARGVEPDGRLAANAERRSVHNNYITLPVLFVMISSHYPSTYGYRHAWLVLMVLFLAGGLVRHYFNVRDRGGNLATSWLLGVAAALVVGAALLTAPPGPDAVVAPAAARVGFAEVRSIIDQRCLSCHSARPASELFKVAPKNLMFDTAEQIRANVKLIRAQAVATSVMPLGNVTRMTREERARLGRWIDEGASIE